MTGAPSIRKLGLGTVQFGLAYGVTNARGQVPAAEVTVILEAALAAGIDLFDTAAASGDSESVLGQTLGRRGDIRIVSALSADRIGGAEIEQCRAALQRSLALLRRRSIYGLLRHRPDDVRKPSAERLVVLVEELKAASTVAKIGISAYDHAQNRSGARPARARRGASAGQPDDACQRRSASRQSRAVAPGPRP